MEHIPTTESYVQKVCRIAKELDISIEQAAVTCDAFHLAFSDEGMRRAIFGMIDELDESAARKGEPLGLIINYSVELTKDGIRVGRYADEVPPGQAVELTPPDQAMIFLRITDDFPTQEVLGPMIVNRPEPLAGEQYPWELPSLDKEGRPIGRGGLTSSDTTQPEIPTELPSHWPKQAICLGPIRLKFNERFPCVAAKPSQRAVLPAGNPAFHSKALKPFDHPMPWGAFAGRMPAFQSGLSPPLHSENLGHSDAKDVPPALGK